MVAAPLRDYWGPVAQSPEGVALLGLAQNRSSVVRPAVHAVDQILEVVAPSADYCEGGRQGGGVRDAAAQSVAEAAP